jgi:hypothetical protein
LHAIPCDQLKLSLVSVEKEQGKDLHVTADSQVLYGGRKKKLEEMGWNGNQPRIPTHG